MVLECSIGLHLTKTFLDKQNTKSLTSIHILFVKTQLIPPILVNIPR